MPPPTQSISLPLTGSRAEPPSCGKFARARRELLITQRGAMIEENRAGRLDDAVLRELDLEELSVSATLTNRLG